MNNADIVNSGEEVAHPAEVLAVVDVIPGRMGRIIGKKGASILSIKQSCRSVPSHPQWRNYICDVLYMTVTKCCTHPRSELGI